MSERIKEEIIELFENDQEFREKIEKKVEESSSEAPGEEEDNGMSRRKFLKKAGLGAAGLSAASFLPSAAGLRVTSGNGIELFDQSSNRPSLNMDSSGEVTVNRLKTDELELGSGDKAGSFDDIVEKNLVNNGGWAPGLNGQ